MSLENLAIVKTNNLPIRHVGNVHDGKVRSVYWLDQEDSSRLAACWNLGRTDNQKGVMVISDRISAYEEIWQTESGLKGVPGKGASLNAIAAHWFGRFDEEGLAGNHILAKPHPLVWIVERADQIMVEAIARQYITGSMWRDYEKKGIRIFGGVTMPEGLQKNQRLDQLLLTPSTKGILRGIPGVPEKDDVNITKHQIVDNYEAFGFKSAEDVVRYETLVREGFALIDRELDADGKVFVDTKFELGYIRNEHGNLVICYTDEIGTPDSSRYWDKKQYVDQGVAKEESKEEFREDLQAAVPDKDILLNKDRMAERDELARTFRVPDEVFMKASRLYTGLAEQITGQPIRKIGDARAEIIESLKPYGIIKVDA